MPAARIGLSTTKGTHAVVGVGMTLAERYRLDERLSSGGVGDVYEARDIALDRAVAVKVIRAADHPDRFLAEARALARLNHPGIVAIHDAGTHEDYPFLVMQLVDGAPLRPGSGGEGLEARDVARAGAEIAEALAYAHDNGVVHRDVKPGNILVDADGTARLVDFGIARLADATSLTATGIAIGTAAYIAPEQIEESRAVGPPADVYALGLVLVELLSGERPFPGSGTGAALARLDRDPEIPEDLDESWRRVLAAMTARSPEARPTAREVADALRTLADTGVSADASGVSRDATRPLPGPDDAAAPTGEVSTSAITTPVTPVIDGQPSGHARRTLGWPAPVARFRERLTRRWRRAEVGPRDLARAAVLVLVAVAAVAIVAVGGQDSPTPRSEAGPEDGTSQQTAPTGETTLPSPLEEAVVRLEESVRP